MENNNKISCNVSFTGYGYSKIKKSSTNVFNEICKTLETQDKVSFDELSDIVQKETKDKLLSVKPFDMLKDIYPQLFKGKMGIGATSISGHYNDGYSIIFADELKKGLFEGIGIFMHEFVHIIQSLKRKDTASLKALDLGTSYTQFQHMFFADKEKPFPKEEYARTFIKDWLDNSKLEKNKKNDYIKFLMERATKEKEAFRLQGQIHEKLKDTKLANDYIKLSRTFNTIVLELKKHLTANSTT